MKNKLLLALVTVLGISALAAIPARHELMIISDQLKVGRISAPNSSAAFTDLPSSVAVLDLESETRGFLPPRMTGAQRDAIAYPVEGLVVHNTTTSKLNYYTGSAWNEVGSGSGGGDEIQYLSGDNSNFNATVGDWVAYADAAGTEPVDATGGSPTVTCTSSSAAPLLEGAASFLITKDASDRQGEGCSVDVTLEPFDAGKRMELRFDYDLSSNFVTGGGSTSDLKVYLVANNDPSFSVIEADGPNGGNILSNSGFFNATFSLPDSTVSYRPAFHVQTTNASAWTFKADNILFHRVDNISGLAGSDEFEIALTTEGLGTTTLDSFRAVIVGSHLKVRGYLKTGTTAASTAAIVLPSGYAIDSSAVSSTTNANKLGDFNRIETGGSATTPDGELFFDGSDTTRLFFTFSAASDQFTKANGSTLFTSGDGIAFDFDIPVSGWTAGVTLSQDKSFRISNVIANGTRVTSKPTKLGEWRSMLRNSGAGTHTDTNGTPSTLPSAANGILIYNGAAWGTADTNNEPTLYQIYVGKGKKIKWIFYSTTGRTGQVNSAATRFATDITGYDYPLEPDSDGVVTILSPYRDGNETSHTGGFGVGTGTTISGFAHVYFDIEVSSDPHPVGISSENNEVVGHTGNGYGGSSSGDTTIRNYATVTTQGTAIRYVPRTTTTADYFEIMESGLYSAYRSDYRASASSSVGFSLNTTQTSTDLGSITNYTTEALAENTTVSNFVGSVAVTFHANRGDILRAHDNGSHSTSTSSAKIRIVKIK